MIPEFARGSGLSIDTVRFYMRKGLLHPEAGRKGRSRPYQVFSPADLEEARIIRSGQALGLSLREIGSFLDRHALDGDATLLAFLADQRDRLTSKVAKLQELISFLDAKMAWVRHPMAIRRHFPL